MRAGGLRHRARLAELHGASLAVRDIGVVDVGLSQREGDIGTEPTGLRSPARVAARARFDERLLPGRYLVTEGRLLIINNRRDPDGRCHTLFLSCDELVGDTGMYRPQAASPRPARIWLEMDSPFTDGRSQKVEYRPRLEVALFECGRPQPGDVFEVRGCSWRVLAAVGDQDNGITRQLWVKPT